MHEGSQEGREIIETRSVGTEKLGHAQCVPCSCLYGQVCCLQRPGALARGVEWLRMCTHCASECEVQVTQQGEIQWVFEIKNVKFREPQMGMRIAPGLHG